MNKPVLLQHAVSICARHAAVALALAAWSGVSGPSTAARDGLAEPGRTAATPPLLDAAPAARQSRGQVGSASALGQPNTPRGLRPVVEVEEDVYNFQPADNGAGPMWCHGSTCLVRVGDRLFASGIETLKDCKPLNNCRWTLYAREPDGWTLLRVDETGRTREPSPMVAFADGRFFLSANPTLVTNRDAYSGPARPAILEFSASDPCAPPKPILPRWDGTPQFTEHSYRSLAADGSRGEFVLFQNIGYTHAEWTFRDNVGNWTCGKLHWPHGKEYPTPGPIRVCYPNVALKDRAVYFCGVSDIVEPYPEWRAFKKQLTGREWDYDFRRLFFTWAPDIRRGGFRDWVEVASRDKTCGGISPGDLWVGPDGAVHLLWTERAIDERLRQKFFPDAKQRHELNYAVVRDGKVVLRRTLALAGEGLGNELPAAGRFQVTPDNRLFVVFYVSGTDTSGRAVSENRVLEMDAAGRPGPAMRLPLERPFTSYFTATPRAGSPSSGTLEMFGHRQGSPQTVSYARVRLW